ncbi:MAG: nucleoside triphosphate pyrophosphohydrolase [Parachlamydiales bacterium]|nr:nucleoside triphosphate pyrophosphohydrolase [Parachlamydiales bacterium]
MDELKKEEKKQKFFFKKLVRDDLILVYEKKGVIVDYRKLDQAEHLHELKKKLVEESQEVFSTTTREELIDELSDLCELIDVIQQKADIPNWEIEKRRKEKIKERGGFMEGIYIDSICIEPSDPIVDYLRKFPEKYPVSEAPLFEK